MKIFEVQAIRADLFCYAKILTDEGIYGIGESGAFGVADASAAQIRSFGLYLVGKNPLDIEHHWQVMFRGMFFAEQPLWAHYPRLMWRCGISRANTTMCRYIS